MTLTSWQTLREIWRLPFGMIIGGWLMVFQIAGGIGIEYHRTERLASIVLGIVYLLFSLACIPGIIAVPAVYAQYGSFFEQFSSVCGAIAVYAATETNAAQALAFGQTFSFLSACSVGYSAASSGRA